MTLKFTPAMQAYIDSVKNKPIDPCIESEGELLARWCTGVIFPVVESKDLETATRLALWVVSVLAGSGASSTCAVAELIMRYRREGPLDQDKVISSD